MTNTDSQLRKTKVKIDKYWHPTEKDKGQYWQILKKTKVKIDKYW